MGSASASACGPTVSLDLSSPVSALHTLDGGSSRRAVAPVGPSRAVAQQREANRGGKAAPVLDPLLAPNPLRRRPGTTPGSSGARRLGSPSGSGIGSGTGSAPRVRSPVLSPPQTPSLSNLANPLDAPNPLHSSSATSRTPRMLESSSHKNRPTSARRVTSARVVASTGTAAPESIMPLG
jgi:hypothetical protein